MLLHHVYKTNVNEEKKLKKMVVKWYQRSKTVAFQSAW